MEVTEFIDQQYFFKSHFK